MNAGSGLAWSEMPGDKDNSEIDSFQILKVFCIYMSYFVEHQAVIKIQALLKEYIQMQAYLLT